MEEKRDLKSYRTCSNKDPPNYGFHLPGRGRLPIFFERERERQRVRQTEMSSTFPYFHSSNETANLVT